MQKNDLGRRLSRIVAVGMLAALPEITLGQEEEAQVFVTGDELHGGDWEFALSPLFLWGVSLDGDATIGDATAPLSLTFKDDILENMEAVFTVHFEARKGKWTIFSELQYLDIEPEVSVAMGPISVDADIDFENTMFELGGAYAFSRTQNSRWEVIGGARYTDQDVGVDTTLTFPEPIGEQRVKMEAGDDWWHAFAGARMYYALSQNWTFIGRADLGYGGSDNSAVNASFMFDYRFKRWLSAFIGYRYLEYDYDNGSSSNRYAFDAYQQGPLAGISLYW